MAMCSLLGFPDFPPDGHIALCELEGRVQSMPADYANILTFTNAVSTYPAIVITQDLLHYTASREDARQVFLPVEETLLKHFINIWYEQGAGSALAQVAEDVENDPESNPVLSGLLSFAMKILEGIHVVQNFFQPHRKTSGVALVSAVSQTRDWATSPVRCLAWHPHCTKLAVAAADDSVRVYSPDSVLVPVIKAKCQQFVTCMAWRPLSASELAIGCDIGVLVWQVDPNSVVTRLSPSCVTVLKRSNHSPVTSLSWSSQGDLLLSASAADTTMYVWDVSMERAAPLHKLLGGGVALVAWSPDTARVFASTCGMVFRVWETSQWTSEHWTLMSGRVQTACWSPCGSMLLFTTSDEPLVYSLSFKPSNVAFQAAADDAVVKALPVIDLTEIELDSGERIGGSVLSMAWDNKGHHLAIVFHQSNVIAVFRTEIQTDLLVSPCCFLKGMSGEKPNAISFQQNFSEGAVLTIAWSSGRIQYFPFICYTDTGMCDKSLRLDWSQLSASGNLSTLDVSRRTQLNTM